REIESQLRELYGTAASPKLISHVTEAVREELIQWQSRPLEPLYAIVWLDALMVKMRGDDGVKSRAVYLAIGVTRAGHKEILGMWIDDNEGAKFWMKVLSELQARGVRDMLIACCDGLKGF